jgi:hypothetical protein
MDGYASAPVRAEGDKAGGSPGNVETLGGFIAKGQPEDHKNRSIRIVSPRETGKSAANTGIS